jgi:hypothetical protein
MHTALAFATTVPGLSTLVVGMPECTVYSRAVAGRAVASRAVASRAVAGRSCDATALHWSYVLDDSEVIFGCGEGLAAAIREMDRNQARTIMVIFTCVPELTGEDIEGILHGLRPQVSASLIPLPAGHFKCNSHPQGLRKALASLCALMEPRDAGVCQTVQNVPSCCAKDAQASAVAVSTQALPAHMDPATQLRFAQDDGGGTFHAVCHRGAGARQSAGVRQDAGARQSAGVRQDAAARSVNVLGWAPGTACVELPRELQVIKNQGFHLRFLSTGTPLEDFRKAPDAVLNLAFSPWAEPLAQEMERCFAVPFCALCDVYGIDVLDAVCAKVTELLQLDAPLFSPERREHAATLHQQAKDVLRGTRYVCAPIGEVSPLPLAQYLAELGMEPLLLHIDDFTPLQRVQAQQLNAKGYDPLVCHMVNARQDAAVLQSLNPDFCFSASPRGAGAEAEVEAEAGAGAEVEPGTGAEAETGAEVEPGTGAEADIKKASGTKPTVWLPSVGALRTQLGYDRMIGLLELLLRTVEEHEGSTSESSSPSATTWQRRG